MTTTWRCFSCRSNTRSSPQRGTTTCDCSGTKKPSRTSAFSASPLCWSGTMSDVCRSATTAQTARKEHTTMETQVINATEHRDLPLSMLFESPSNPRRNFDENFLKGMAASMRVQGVLQRLLARPKEKRFEIVFGAQRFRAAQLAELPTIPVDIREMSDAEVLEAQLVENLQRRDVHPMEEAQGFKGLLDLEEPKYTVEQIAAKMGKTPAYVTTRLKLTDLAPVVVEAFYAEEIGVGHALLLAKLQPDQQEQALAACFKEVYNGGTKPTRVLLPLRNLQFWIDTNILLLLK